jgi:mono/diheme cytochrome c family protein
MARPADSILVALSLFSLPLAALAAQANEGPPRWAANIARKQFVIMQGIPRNYASLTDPSPDSELKLRRGAQLFDRNCAACHGWTGQGGGPDAFALVPQPADLEWLANTPKGRANPYIYWSIAEGGSAFDSDMPSFKETLSDQEIWMLTAYVRAGLPRRPP